MTLSLKHYQSASNLFADYSNAILSTVIIYIIRINVFFPFHLVLDSGSEISALTYEMSKILGLRHYSINSSLIGINGLIFYRNRQSYIDNTFFMFKFIFKEKKKSL